MVFCTFIINKRSFMVILCLYSYDEIALIYMSDYTVKPYKFGLIGASE